MRYLKICPKCHANLKLRPDGETQYYSICKYWTKAGTAILDSIMIFGQRVCMKNTEVFNIWDY